MWLLEFHYWSDVVMFLSIYGAICLTIILGLAIRYRKTLWKILKAVNGGPPSPPKKGKTIGYFSKISIYDNKQLIFSLTGKLNIMALELTNTQQASGVLTFKDKKLAITDVPDGAVTLTSSDENVFTTSYEDATNTVTVVAGNVGVAALSIKATNKAGADIPFEDIAIEVKSGDAVTGGVAFGTPTEQP